MIDDAERVVAGVKMALFRAIIEDTPVKIGRLAGNWQSTLASPAIGETSRTGKGAAIAAINTGTMRDTAFLTNNLPYAETVEYGLFPDGPKTSGGFSKKSPEGMVRRNVARINQLITRANRKGLI